MNADSIELRKRVEKRFWILCSGLSDHEIKKAYLAELLRVHRPSQADLLNKVSQNEQLIDDLIQTYEAEDREIYPEFYLRENFEERQDVKIANKLIQEKLIHDKITNGISKAQAARNVLETDSADVAYRQQRKRIRDLDAQRSHESKVEKMVLDTFDRFEINETLMAQCELWAEAVAEVNKAFESNDLARYQTAIHDLNRISDQHPIFFYLSLVIEPAEINRRRFAGYLQRIEDEKYYKELEQATGCKPLSKREVIELMHRYGLLGSLRSKSKKKEKKAMKS